MDAFHPIRSFCMVKILAGQTCRAFDRHLLILLTLHNPDGLIRDWIPNGSHGFHSTGMERFRVLDTANARNCVGIVQVGQGSTFPDGSRI